MNCWLIHDYSSSTSFENRTGGVAPHDDRGVLHDGSSLEFYTAPIHAFSIVHTIFNISLAVVRRSDRWFHSCVCGGDEYFGLVVQCASVVLAFVSGHDFMCMGLLTFDIDDDAYKR